MIKKIVLKIYSPTAVFYALWYMQIDFLYLLQNHNHAKKIINSYELHSVWRAYVCLSFHKI